MSASESSKTTAAFYKHHRVSSPSDPAAQLGWTDFAEQRKNFDFVLGLATEKLGTLRGRTIHDAGCGHGDLLTSLIERHGVDSSAYTGTDFDEAALAVARQRHPWVTFNRLDYTDPAASLPNVDVTFAVGTLAYHDAETAIAMFERLLAASRKALVLMTWWNLPPGFLFRTETAALQRHIERRMKEMRSALALRSSTQAGIILMK